MRKKLIAMLAAGVMLAQAIPAFADFSDDFNSYDAGALNGQNGWTASGVTVATDPLNAEGSQVALASGNYASSSKVFVAQTGDTVDVSFDFMLEGKGSGGKTAGTLFSVYDGEKPIAILAALILSNGVHPYALNPKVGSTQNSANYSPGAFAMAANDTFSRTNMGYQDPKDFYKLAEWVKFTSNGQDNGTPIKQWNYARFILDFTNHEVNVYISKTSPVTDEMITNNTGISYKGTYPFIDDTAEKVDTFKFERENATTTPAAIDNLSILGTSAAVSGVALEEFDVSAVHNNTTGTVRFTSTVTGGDADAAGACVVPVRLFTDEATLEGGASPVAKVNINEAVAEGEKFGVDVTGIPAAQFDTQLVAKPFVVVDGDVIWAQYTQTTSVNAAIN